MRAALAVLGLAALFVLLVPGTPWSLGHGDVLAAHGQPRAAVAWYRLVARVTLDAPTRQTAWRRADVVARADLDDLHLAEALLVERLGGEVLRRSRAKILAALADLQRRRSANELAASTWERAVDEAPRHRDAPSWLLERAEVLLERGLVDAADAEFARIYRQYPRERARASLGRARIALASGRHHEALRLFDDSLAHGPSSEVEAVARLGSAVCLERLGDLDEALVMLDAPELPDAVRAVRSDGLRRLSEAGGL